MAKRVLILGSTGSIGEQALDVIGRSEALELAGLSAATNWERLCVQARESGVPVVALTDPAAAERAGAELDGVRVLAGDEGVRELIAASEADLVLNAIVGTAGLGPTIVALSEGIDLALANKESLVVGGELVTALAEATQAQILPVDSEHSAIFQLLRAEEGPGTVERLILTASGGPFRGRSDLGQVTVEEALAHPTWEMGGRITIDSATLLNKGLELIEAHHLFGLPYGRIDVVVHPQSIVHSLIELNDGAQLAHLGLPDMRVPISYALHFPERADVTVPRLDLAAAGRLEFEQPDLETFPCLRLAREAGEAAATAPCALNAADEVAVAAFLEGRIPFTAIAEVIASVLERTESSPIGHFEQLFECDARARRLAEELVGQGGYRVSWILAFAGFSFLIIAHEAGHMVAAKAVGMRVERFFLFFPPKLWSFKRGETEYGIGAIPLGGFVKITGMNPDEELDEEVAPRGYYHQPVWKRIVVIGAGPFVNFMIAFVILFALGFTLEKATAVAVDNVEPGTPAQAHLEPGDRVLSINGVDSGAGSPEEQSQRLVAALDGAECAGGQQVDGCRATEAMPIVVRRDGETMTINVRPFYDAEAERFRFGFSFVGAGLVPADRTISSSADFAVDRMWDVTSSTVGIVGRIFDAEQRKEISGIVGSYEVTRQSIEFDTRQALFVLALISLSLAVINLFPFLPLDGGHIFWSLVEKVRGRPVAFRVMERASVVGFVLVLMLFVIGLSNDIDRLTGEGFGVR